MNAILFAAALSLSAIAQASEISDFPIGATRSSVSRASVQTQAAQHANQPRYDISGPLVEPMSTRSREEVRREAAARPTFAQAVTMDHIGGM